VGARRSMSQHVWCRLARHAGGGHRDAVLLWLVPEEGFEPPTKGL
jgi:hypothetical protein